ncbi:MAG: hypothetical protein CL607_06615 [Anaerolineaceae bacterium]|nr:hypothetical protein [Anaerolineaceae bacterium]
MIAGPVVVLILVIAMAVVYLLYDAMMNKTGLRTKGPLVIDDEALDDDELQSYLPDQKIAAIKRYRELTGVGLAEAKRAIEAVIADPDAAKNKRKRALHRLSDDAQGAGVRDLIAEGKLDEAAEVYAQFMGVDTYTARAAIADMAEEITANHSIK